MKESKEYYNVAGHVFTVNRELDPAYEPFHIENGRPVFDVNIKMEKFKGKLSKAVITQKEHEVEIRVGTHNRKYYYEFRLFNKRAAVLLTDIMYHQATLIIEQYPKYAIDSALMVMYALSTANQATLLFHSSVVMQGGYAYMFLGKSGTGKSTHSQMWIRTIKGSVLLNDDNPVVRTFSGGRTYVYGSPWSGKTPCYKNDYSPLGGVIMLGQSSENKIKSVFEDSDTAYKIIISSVSGTRWDERIRNGQHHTTMKLLHYVPLYYLWCRPDKEAAKVCHDGVCIARKVSQGG